MNRLQNASSPYLRQHADNPVEWFEWSSEAFERARAEDKPIFLSVGYSSCHWCHVMAHESFEDEQVAKALNERFVSIKVDREERPDVDSVYMNAVQAMTGRGGWPMSVFITPEGVPFFGGTYWPREPRHGMPGFLDVVEAVDTAWQTQRDQVLESGERLSERLRAANEVTGASSAASEAVASAAVKATISMWDRHLGGFGSAPKFPGAMTIDFLLAHHLRTGDGEALEAAVHSLDAMARGGIYDHVGGGFARYSTDAQWLVPHFEKMLYDNALLLRAYTHGWQITRRAQLRRIVTETADYLLREMRHERGGLYSATDADSEGIEGKFFVWSPTEFDEVVRGAGEDPVKMRAFFGVTDEGNFIDHHHPEFTPVNVLHEPEARAEGDSKQTGQIARVRGALYARREERVHPGLDDKVLTSWNALALGALAEAGTALGRDDYIDAARRCAVFLHDELVDRSEPDRPRLLHTWKDGHGAKVGAFLEDVAYLAQALLVLYEADPDPQWVAWAAQLAFDAEERFADGAGAYFATASDAEQLLTRPKDLWDNATPAGSSVMVDVHLRLAALTGHAAHEHLARRTLEVFGGRAQQAPTGYGEMLRGLERLLSGPQEVAIVGPPADDRTSDLVRVYRETWRPGSVLAVGPGDTDVPPLLSGRPLVDGAPAAYVCRGFVCERPVTGPEELRQLLDS